MCSLVPIFEFQFVGTGLQEWPGTEPAQHCKEKGWEANRLRFYPQSVLHSVCVCVDTRQYFCLWKSEQDFLWMAILKATELLSQCLIWASLSLTLPCLTQSFQNLPILFKTKTSFLLPSARRTVSSIWKQRQPNGSLASKTSRITSEYSTTCRTENTKEEGWEWTR